MDNRLKELYRELLLTKFSDGKTVFERIKPDDLCVAGHHVGRLYNKGMLIYGQAMNGWQNNFFDMDSLIDEIEKSADNHKELYTMVDYKGWHSEDRKKSYYYKRSKFWKLNYQVVTNSIDPYFDEFYIKCVSENEREDLLDNAWSQTVAWSNLYKISFSKGGNPDYSIIDKINEISLKIILREIEVFKPNKVLFNTGENFFNNIALSNKNVFDLTKVKGSDNILYVGEYEYSTNEKCKMIVCRRPDEVRLHYKNVDIVKEAREILMAFESI